MQHFLRAMRSRTFSVRQLSPSPPTARRGSVRRCSASASPRQPPPSPPLPPGGGGHGGASGNGGSGGDGGGGSSGPHWFRHVAQITAGVLGATAVATASLPSLLSTQWGLQNAVELLNSHLKPPGRVEVAGAALSWIGPTELHCVKVYDSPRGGQILLHLNRVSTSSSLWQLLTGGGCHNVLIVKPWINMVYDARISDFKLVHFMERVGLLRPPEPKPAPSSSGTKAAGEAGASSSQQQQPQGQPQGQQQVQAEQRNQQDEQQQQGRGKQKRKGQQGAREQQQPGRLIEVLGRVNSKMELNADVRLGRVYLMVTDGLLLVPDEVRQVLGPRLHVTGAIGDAELREWGAEVGEDVSWADRAAAHRVAAGAGEGDGDSAASPPPEVLRRPGQYQPGVMQVRSAHLRGEMRLWDGPDHSLLHTPATASLALTPALSRLALAAANPVLGGVVEVRGGGRLSGTFNPEGGRLPYQAATVEMEPVFMELGPSSLPLKLLGDLGLSERAWLAAAMAVRKATGDGGNADGADGYGPLSSVSVSRMRVHFNRDGHVRTDRVDMRLGGGSGAAAAAGDGAEGAASGGRGGIQLAVWGGADLQRDELRFTLGVSPAPLLAALGLGTEGLPPGYLLLVPVYGAVSEPRYDVAGAAMRLGQLGARQRAVRFLEQRGAEEADGEGGSGGGGGRLGALAAGLGALVEALAPAEDLVALVDRGLREDMDRVPPPLSQPRTTTAAQSTGGAAPPT